MATSLSKLQRTYIIINIHPLIILDNCRVVKSNVFLLIIMIDNDKSRFAFVRHLVCCMGNH